jgi:alpha-beta hydrolase superfamily lysophospholipase
VTRLPNPARVRPRTLARAWRTCLLIVGTLAGGAAPAVAQDTATVTLRGKPQTVRLYGDRKGEPIIVSSGDGGWVHLAPHVADVLSSHGYFIVGLDVRAYLSSFTSGSTTLRPEDEPGDFDALARYAAGTRAVRPILVGVSEGAGLSVLAATDPKTKALVGGVIALGLPDINELGWHWRDAIIYITKGVPREPVFSTKGMIDRVAPTPLALIQSTHDEFTPLALTQELFAKAKDPKRLWTIDAVDHRFSNSLDEFDRRLLEAIAWIKSAR